MNASSDFQCCDRNVRRILNGSIAIPIENSILTKTFRSYQVITLAYILYEQHPHSKYYSTRRYQTLNDFEMGFFFLKEKAAKRFDSKTKQDKYFLRSGVCRSGRSMISMKTVTQSFFTRIAPYICAKKFKHHFNIFYLSFSLCEVGEFIMKYENVRIPWIS